MTGSQMKFWLIGITLILAVCAQAQISPREVAVRRVIDALARTHHTPPDPRIPAREAKELAAAQLDFENAMRDLGRVCDAATAPRLKKEFRTFEEWLTMVAFDRNQRLDLYLRLDRKYVQEVDSSRGAVMPFIVRTVPAEFINEEHRLIWEFAIIRPALPDSGRAGVSAAYQALSGFESLDTARFVKVYAEFLARPEISTDTFRWFCMRMQGVLGMYPSPEAADALITLYAAALRSERVDRGEALTKLSDRLIEARRAVASILSGREMGPEHAQAWQTLSANWPRRGLSREIRDLLTSAGRGRMPDSVWDSSMRGKGFGDPPSVGDL